MADFKLGKLEARYVPTDHFYTEYRNSTAPITVPSVFGHGNSYTDWAALGNDQYGSCVWSGFAHEVELINNLAAGGVTGQVVVPFDDKSVLSDYSAQTGFNPADPNTDKGTDVHSALDYRISQGIVDANGKRHKIAAYVALDVGNLALLREAAYLFEAVGMGFQFPDSGMTQFNSGQVWSVVPGASIIGGHYVPVVGVPAVGNLAVVTWGKRQVMTDAFFTKYCDEAYAFITQEELNKRTQKSWGGVDWAHLQADLKIV